MTGWHMRSLLRIAVGTCAAMALTAAPVDAASSVSVSEGHTTAFTPDVLLGGSMSYSATSDACVAAMARGVAGIDCTTSFSGQLVNTICGTGSLSGTFAETEPDGSVVTASYGGTMTGGIGVLTGGMQGVFAIVPWTAPLPTCMTGFYFAGAWVL